MSRETGEDHKEKRTSSHTAALVLCLITVPLVSSFSSDVQFTDVTQPLAIGFKHENSPTSFTSDWRAPSKRVRSRSHGHQV